MLDSKEEMRRNNIMRLWKLESERKFIDYKIEKVKKEIDESSKIE